jgi:hypothetical protein
VLETDDRVVGTAHDDHVPGGLASPPSLDPQIVEIVDMDVRRNGEVTAPSGSPPRSRRACPCPAPRPSAISGRVREHSECCVP